MIKFYKYQGAGNDFILIDNRLNSFEGNKVEFAIKWCDRKFGIGSDGIIFLEESDKTDFKMDFYNPDGSQSFCGNGSRCVVAFARDLEIVKDKTIFEAIDGKHEGVLLEKNVKIAMNQYGGIERVGEDHFIDTGSPHYISYCGDGDQREIVTYGKEIRYSDKYQKKGTNVNLITEIKEGSIKVRTYERGVENETLACGTGATACGLSYASTKDINEGIVEVAVKGGELKIHFSKTTVKDKFSDIWLEGPAVFVFKGEING